MLMQLHTGCDLFRALLRLFGAHPCKMCDFLQVRAVNSEVVDSYLCVRFTVLLEVLLSYQNDSSFQT